MKYLYCENSTATTNIGSFRNDTNIKLLLPPQLYDEIFKDISTEMQVSRLVTVNQNQVNFNNGAFGHAYDEVIKLNKMLRKFSESQPEIFYDQVCLQLINYTYEIATNFFDSENVLLVPNCTFGMRCIAELLIREKKNSNVACLLPIYGATFKLLKYYKSAHLIENLTTIAPGENPLLEENPMIIRKALEDAYNNYPYTVLFCDEVASQSGRCVSLKVISDFCKEKSIKLVVDGTQSCQIFFGQKKSVLKDVDYFVMSTHKWLGNTKTCGIILYNNEPPPPPAISFGWEPTTQKCLIAEKTRASFQWLGMMDSYISYITLSKALKIFRLYGEKQFNYSCTLLHRGLEDILKVKSLLPSGKDRVMNIFELNNSQLEPLGNINKIQNCLQNYGVFISVKRLGQDCGGLNVDGQNLQGENVQNDVHSGGSEVTNHYDKSTNDVRYDPETATHATSNNVSEIFEDVPNNGTKEMDNASTAVACIKPRENFYLRISCWSFNKIDDFEALKQIFNNNLRLSTSTAVSLRSQFLFIYELYERLFSVLEIKGFFIRAERLRHHLIFYLAHTAVFFVNKLVVSGYLDSLERIDPRLESIMAVGVDEMSWDDLLEENYDWTGMNDLQLKNYLEYVCDYRERVKELVLRLIDKYPAVNPIQPGSFQWIILMGIEHEKIHLETSAVIISQVPLSLIKANHDFNFPTYWKGRTSIVSVKETLISKSPSEAPVNCLIHIPGGTVLMGKSNLEQDYYGWDNEFGSEQKVLESFEASQMLVSNAEYLEFIEDGAYSNPKWWSTEGWKYVTDLQITAPRFWRNKTHYRAMLEEIPMPWNLPVEVNNLEAEAFCNWKSEKLGKKVRLISQEEAFHMRQIATGESANLNLNMYASPTPVNLYGGFIDGKKVYDISGNVWRHSVSVLTLMDGFRTDPFYNDFTLPTIDGFHNHILGGSWISLGNCANLNARYGFRRHFYQYAGIRYVVSENSYHDNVTKIYDEVEITRFITENYTNFTKEMTLEKQPVLNWPKLLGEKAAKFINIEYEQMETLNPKRLLTVMGGVGRTTLEILRHCRNVSIDHSDSTANRLQVLESLLSDSRIQWYQQVEGKLVQPLQFHMDDTSETLLSFRGNSIAYWQADYKNIRPQLDGYDIIVADFRYKDTATEIHNLASRLKDNGLLILGSIDNTTDAVNYGKNHSMHVLQRYFKRVETIDEKVYAHMYEETRNKHQYAISYLSVWRKLASNVLQREDITESKVIFNSSTPTSAVHYYNDQNILLSYNKFHFSEGLLSLKNFPLRMSEIILDACRKFQCSKNSALDAGCGPGRTALELCSSFNKVEAYDYSEAFIEMLLKHKAERNFTNLVCYQGDSHKQEEVCREKKFDMILGCNLIDRLHTPEAWLQQSKRMLNPGGLFIISSPYTWKEEYTSSEKWVGGFKRDGEDFFTVDGLKQLLAPELVLLEEVRVPFIIPDADGTYQYTYSNCTIFGQVKKL